MSFEFKQDKVINAYFAFIFLIFLLVSQNGQSGQVGQDDSVSANTGFDGSSGDSYCVYAYIRYIALENCEMSHAWHEDIVKEEQYSASPEAAIHRRFGDRIALVTFVISQFQSV